MIEFDAIVDKAKYQRQRVILVLFILALHLFMGGWNFELPGIQMDEVNHSAFVLGILDEDAALLHHYRLPDNYIDRKDGINRYPILGGSFYNSAVTAYLGLPVYKVIGFSIESLRYFHGGIGFLCVLLGSLLFARFVGFLPAYCFAALISTNPDFVFSLRSQGAVFWPVVLFVLVAVYLFSFSQSTASTRRKFWLIFSSGVCLGFSVMSYFVGAFFVLPIIVYAWYQLNNSKKHLHVLLLGIFIGYIPVIYSIISVYLVSPILLSTFGMPNFAIKNELAVFSFENILRTITLIKNGVISYSFTNSVVGHFPNASIVLKAFALAMLIASVLWSLLRFRFSYGRASLLIISIAILVVYVIGAFILKGLNTHHFLPLIFIFSMQVSLLISMRSSLKYFSLLIGAMLTISNITTLMLAHDKLETTGGLGYHNEMFAKSADFLNSECSDCHPVFVSWGLHLQFLFLTEGRHKYTFLPGATADRLEELIFKYGKITLIGVEDDIAELEISSEDIKVFDSHDFAQRNGQPLYQMKMFRITDDRFEAISNLSVEFIDWGPRSTRSGIIPNPQPGGFGGIWILANVDSGFGSLQLMFDGKPAEHTQISVKSITALIDAENFKIPGEKQIKIRQALTGREFPVGTFIVSENQIR